MQDTEIVLEDTPSTVHFRVHVPNDFRVRIPGLSPAIEATSVLDTSHTILSL